VDPAALLVRDGMMRWIRLNISAPVAVKLSTAALGSRPLDPRATNHGEEVITNKGG
jgi:hypothetical protein